MGSWTARWVGSVSPFSPSLPHPFFFLSLCVLSLPFCPLHTAAPRIVTCTLSDSSCVYMRSFVMVLFSLILAMCRSDHINREALPVNIHSFQLYIICKELCNTRVGFITLYLHCKQEYLYNSIIHVWNVWGMMIVVEGKLISLFYRSWIASSIRWCTWQSIWSGIQQNYDRWAKTLSTAVESCVICWLACQLKPHRPLNLTLR